MNTVIIHNVSLHLTRFNFKNKESSFACRGDQVTVFTLVNV